METVILWSNYSFARPYTHKETLNMKASCCATWYCHVLFGFFLRDWITNQLVTLNYKRVLGVYMTFYMFRTYVCERLTINEDCLVTTARTVNKLFSEHFPSGSSVLFMSRKKVVTSSFLNQSVTLADYRRWVAHFSSQVSCHFSSQVL